jgi:hypothetical protein
MMFISSTEHVCFTKVSRTLVTSGFCGPISIDELDDQGIQKCRLFHCVVVEGGGVNIVLRKNSK